MLFRSPRDLQAWLDLIAHQEPMLVLGRPSPVLNESDRRNLADVRISTYEQALRKVGDDKNSQTKLHLGLMTEAPRTWDNAKLAKRWTDILKKFPSDPELWLKYLDFVQGSFTNFKHDKCRATYHQCLKALQTSPDTVGPELYLHVLTRLTSMIRSSGYQELAVAIWQALLEFHILPPNSTSMEMSRSDSVQQFEEYWESEVARIGEANAKGWRNFNAEDSTDRKSVV